MNGTGKIINNSNYRSGMAKTFCGKGKGEQKRFTSKINKIFIIYNVIKYLYN